MMRLSVMSQGLGCGKESLKKTRDSRGLFRPRGYFNQRLGARAGVDYGSAGPFRIERDGALASLESLRRKYCSTARRYSRNDMNGRPWSSQYEAWRISLSHYVAEIFFDCV
jgi:hypothetical protein